MKWFRFGCGGEGNRVTILILWHTTVHHVEDHGWGRWGRLDSPNPMKWIMWQSTVHHHPKWIPDDWQVGIYFNFGWHVAPAAPAPLFSEGHVPGSCWIWDHFRICSSPYIDPRPPNEKKDNTRTTRQRNRGLNLWAGWEDLTQGCNGWEVLVVKGHGPNT